MKINMKNKRLNVVLAGLCTAAIMFGFTAGNVLAEPAATEEKAAAAKHGDAGAVGAKLANPLGNLWSWNFNFNLVQAFDGDLNKVIPSMAQC
jgi:hypothetical protein